MHQDHEPPGPLARIYDQMNRARTTGPAHRISGIIHRVTPNCITVSGLSKFVSIGHIVSIGSYGTKNLAEVASIDCGTINITPITPGAKVELGARVYIMNGPLTLAPHTSWKGRVVNALGQPIDDGGPLENGSDSLPIDGQSPPPMQRQRLGRKMTTGVKVIDFFTPICAGQRLGIFAGSGVGKSTLLAMLSRAPSFDMIVLSLVGERGREVREFLDDTLGANLSNVVTVVATADETPMMRRLAPNAAMCIAEYFRKQGEQVLLVVDSITRYAHAMRELALAAQEPPIARGYPPSVFGALPRLLERAGTCELGAGAITAVISVLVDGDDHNDPIADTVRGILDGHVVLERSIAAQDRFPALDPLSSISRLAPKVRSPIQKQLVSQIIQMISRFEETKDLRTIGGYRNGSDANLDRALEVVPRIYEIMKQGGADPIVEDVFELVSRSLTRSP